jgi:hypothetical protein
MDTLTLLALLPLYPLVVKAQTSGGGSGTVKEVCGDCVSFGFVLIPTKWVVLVAGEWPAVYPNPTHPIPSQRRSFVRPLSFYFWALVLRTSTRRQQPTN